MQSDCAFSKEKNGRAIATTPYSCGSIRIRCNSTPHSECIFPQGQRTPTLGTSNNLPEYSHSGELNKGPWNTWIPSLCTHRKGKADERRKKWPRKRHLWFCKPQTFCKHWESSIKVLWCSQQWDPAGILHAHCSWDQY